MPVLSQSRTKTKEVITATPATIRRINRSIILNLVRLHEPISRKELSDISGIYRSNVSAIVEDLLKEGLLMEQRTRPLGPGRTPVHLFLNSGHLRVLGVSLRSDLTTISWAGLSGRILSSQSFETPGRPDDFVRKLNAAVAEFRASVEEMGSGVLHRIGLSVPGLIDTASGTVMRTPTLPQFRGYPLANEIARHIGAPIVADNDANVTVLAEQWFGEREVTREANLVLLSVSDYGVGSGVVVNSNLYRGHNGTRGGEFGHMVIDRNGPKCSCGRRGCWELYISDQATWRRYDPDRRFTPALFQDLIRLALDGDPRAINAFEETATYLSLGLSNIMFAINPSSIIVVGEITKVWKLIRRTVEGAWRSPGLDAQIRVSPHSLHTLQTQGTVVLALQDIFAEPEFGLHKTASGTAKRARVHRPGAGRHASPAKSG